MTERFALLVGVNTYAADSVRDLPIALDDVAALERSLRTSGYDVRSVTGAPGQQPPSRGVIRGEVRQFLSNVPAGSTALVYFSCHGAHLDGTDYLLPWDAPGRVHPAIADDLLPADLARIAGTELDSCLATTLVLAVDACRDEVDLAKAAFDEFGQGAQTDASRRRVYTLFACTADTTAGFDKELGASVFTFALAEAMRAETSPSTLSEVVEFVRERMAALCRQYDLPAQEPAYRLEADGGSGADRVICSSPADDPTAAELVRAFTSLGAADGHGVGEGVDELVQRSVELMRESSRDRLADVWLDPDLPRRTVDAAKVLFERTAVLGDATAEERLLAAGLLLAVDVTLRWAVASGEHSSYQREVERAAGRYPGLERRCGYLTERGETTTVHRIRGWLEHRAALAVPELWSSPPFTELVELLATNVESRAPHRADLVDTLRAITVDVVAGRSATVPVDKLLVVNDRSASGRPLDIRRTALAMRLVRAMSADLRVYGEPIVQEIGLRTGLDAQVAAQELTGLTWLVDNDGRVLLPSIRCSEPAVDQVVRNVATDVRAVLTDVTGVLDDVLDVSDRDVQPRRVGEHPAYTVPVPTITLDTAAVRQLLIGKDLYGSPDVVIRELYQNALDACRYRAARERYLDLTTPGRTSDWAGTIQFSVHELDDGALVLDCIDNGVGMGDVEVDQAFTCAGRRFTDLPSFHHEADAWAAVDPALRIYPNSRFGIGVFSYFMLAEEVEVFTVRHDTRGAMQSGLALHLSAVSGLVAKRPLPSDSPEYATVRQGGTLVRLHLDRGAWTSLGRSLIRVVEEMLGYAEFAVTLSDGDDSAAWTAGELIGHLAEAFPAFEYGGTRGWWVDDEVPLLSDGIRLSTTTAGYLVNLCGPQQPKLDVSRNTVDSWPQAWVRDRFAEAAAGVREWPDFCLAYLWRLTNSDAALADAVYEQVGTGWLPVVPGDQPDDDLDEDIAHVGVFPADHWMAQEFEDIEPDFGFDDEDRDEDDDRWSWSASFVGWRRQAWEPWQIILHGFPTKDDSHPLEARATEVPLRWGRPAPSPLDSALLGEIAYVVHRPESVRVSFARLVRGAAEVEMGVVEALRRVLRFATCDVQPVALPTLAGIATLPRQRRHHSPATRFLTSWIGDEPPPVVVMGAVRQGIPVADLGAAARALGYDALADLAAAAGEPSEDLRPVLARAHASGPRSESLARAVARMDDPSAALAWIDRVDATLGTWLREQLPMTAVAQANAGHHPNLPTWMLWDDEASAWVAGPVSWRTILRWARFGRTTVAETVQALVPYPAVELPPDAERVAAGMGHVPDRAADLLGITPLPNMTRRNGPLSRLLQTSRNERTTAAALKAELSDYKALGVIPATLLSKRAWPTVSDRQLDLVEAWENLLGEDEACRREPRPLSVLETFAFVETVQGDLHRVLDEIAELRGCGMRTTLDVSSSSTSVDAESLRLGVLLHQGWEPRIALAALSLGVGADRLCEANQWWLAQCPEGAPLAGLEVEPPSDDLDWEAGLALVAATRNGAATAPDIQPADVILTAARAQVTVGEVVAACERLAFEVPALSCEPDYRPDWVDGALAALLLAIAAPPAEAELPLVGELIGVPTEDVPVRLQRFSPRQPSPSTDVS